MGSGDVSQLTFQKICDLCEKYSHGQAKMGNETRDILFPNFPNHPQVGSLELNWETC